MQTARQMAPFGRMKNHQQAHRLITLITKSVWQGSVKQQTAPRFKRVNTPPYPVVNFSL